MKRFILILTIVFAGISAFAQKGSSVESIYPPNWWTGMENSSLQLMVYGKGIANFTPTVSYPGVTLESVIKVENANYLFLNLKMDAGVKPGKFSITFGQQKKSFACEYELKARLPREGRQQGLTPADVAYLIMPDRFANGNTANDSIPGYPDKYSRTNPNGRHGGDLQGIIDRLPYLQGLGITAIWLTPFQENNEQSTAYHGYAITNHYKVDPRFGTNEDYKRLVAEAHKHGIKVIIDVVFNQVGLRHQQNIDRPCGDWFHQFPTYTGTTYEGVTIPDPHASQRDRMLMEKGWFTQSMPDLNQNTPLVENYLRQNVTWWIEYSNLDVIRFDTYQYNDKEMLARWAKQLRVEYPNFFTFVEVWVDSPAIVSAWQENGSDRTYQSYIPSVVDFPLQYGIRNTLVEGKSVREIYNVLTNDFLYSNPGVSVTFFDNHDLDRFYSSAGEDLNKLKMATAIVLTTRGIPQLYYGDEILMTGTKHESGEGFRRKRFPGGWGTESVCAFTAEGRKGLAADYYNYINKMLSWRKANADLMSGKLLHFVPEKEIYVYFRQAGDKTAMVVVNNNDTDVAVDLSRFSEVLNRYSEGKDIITDKTFSLSEPMPVVKRSASVLMLR